MSGNGTTESTHHPIDLVRELDEVINLIHFLGRSKPGGFTAALGWAEERLRVVREVTAQSEASRGNPAQETGGNGGLRQSFPLLRNLAALSAEGNRP